MRARLFVCLAAVLFLSACEEGSLPTGTTGGQTVSQEDTAPAISALEVNPESSGLMRLRARATDPKSAMITYAWQVDGGTLSADFGPSVMWRPPSTPGSYSVMVTVTNAKGESRSAAQRFEVKADGKTQAKTPVVVSDASGRFASGGFQVPSPLPRASATTGSTPTPSAAGTATPRPSPTAPAQPPFATPTPTPTPPMPPASPTPTPTPTAQAGVPVPPPSQWFQVATTQVPTTQNLYGVYFIPFTGVAAAASPFAEWTTGWVVGNGGTVLRTTNGGASWVAANVGVPADLTLRHVYFPRPDLGFIAGGGDASMVMRTTDSGATWQNIAPGSLGATQITAMTVFDDQIVEVCTDDGLLFRTENAGAVAPGAVTWGTVDTKPPTRPNDVTGYLGTATAFPPLDKTLAWYFGDGIYWHDKDNPDPALVWRRFQYLGGKTAGAAFMTSPNDAWMGLSSAGGPLYRSSTLGGGSPSWEAISTFPNREYNGGPREFAIGPISAIAFVDQDNGWFLSGAEIYETDNARAFTPSWRRTTLPNSLYGMRVQNRYLNGVRQFFGWAVGSGGAIFRYTPVN